MRVTTAARLALIIATVKKWSLFLYDHSILHVVASYYTTRRTTSYRGGLNSDGQYLKTLVLSFNHTHTYIHVLVQYIPRFYDIFSSPVLRILLVLDLASTSVATSRYRYTIPVPFKVPSLRLGPPKPL